MNDSVIVLGAGGHAKVVVELLRASGYFVAGLLDADPELRQVLGVEVLGDDAMLAKLYADGATHAFVAVGDNRVRARLGQAVKGIGFLLVNAVSPNAYLSPSAQIGEGVAIMAGVVVNAEAVIGDLAILNTCATVDHDCVLGASCHLAPGTAVAGGVRIGPGVLLGVGASAIPGVSIGAGSIIGAGAAVTCDIPAGVLALGVPARVVRRLESAS